MQIFLLCAVAIAVLLLAGWLMRAWLRRQNNTPLAHYRLLQVILWVGGAGLLLALGLCIVFPGLRPSPPIAMLIGAVVLFTALRLRSLLRQITPKN